jgi:hypothetical protein
MPSVVAYQLERLVTVLGEMFGRDAVQINGVYHVQVRTPVPNSEPPRTRVVHEIWLRGTGEFRVRRYGESQTRLLYSIEDVQQYLEQHHAGDTALARAAKALDMVKLESHALRCMPREGLQAAFCDAGWRLYQAQLGVVVVTRTRHGLALHVRRVPLQTKSVEEAEYRAIKLAASMVGKWTPIMSDSQHAVERARQEYGTRVSWISRDQNRAADQVAHTRRRRR